MALVRNRGGIFFVVFWWEGKSRIKAIGPIRPKRSGSEPKSKSSSRVSVRATPCWPANYSPKASPSWMSCSARPRSPCGSDASPRAAPPLPPSPAAPPADNPAETNPLSLKELADKYLAQLKTTAGSDHLYATELWSRALRRYLGNDRAVMSLTLADLEAYCSKRVGPNGERNIRAKREIGTLKAAIDWAIDHNLLTSSPISRWPKFKTSPQKRFEWKADIEATIKNHTLKTEKDRQDFLKEMSARLVLTAQDMQSLVKTAREKTPELALPLMVVCATGTRRKEMVMLNKQDLIPSGARSSWGQASSRRPRRSPIGPSCCQSKWRPT